MARKFDLSPEEYMSIYSKVPRLVVGLIINNENGILLAKRRSGGWVGKWHFPGGMVRYREKLTDSVQRIAKEELGMSVNIVKTLGYVEYFSEESERGFGYTICLPFLVEPENYNFAQGEQYDEKAFFQELPNGTIDEEKEFLSKLNLK